MSLALEPLVDQLKAAAQPTRLRLLAVCAAGELTVGELTRIVGQSQPRVSRHLRVLCDAGLLLRFRERHFVYYRVPAAGPARRLVDAILGALDKNDTRISRDLATLRRVLHERSERAQQVMARAAEAADFADPGIDVQSIADEILRLTDVEAMGDLLDIGTGTGRILALFGPHARSAVGIDISSDMLLVARSNVHAAGLDTVMVRHGDMYRLPYPDASFDTITVDQVLTQAEWPERVLQEAARILRPNGQLLVVDVDPREPGVAGCCTRLEEWAGQASLQLAGLGNIAGEKTDFIVSLLRHTADAEDEAA